jgi:uncharacterized membrane protein
MNTLPRSVRLILLLSLALNLGLGAALLSMHLHVRDAQGAVDDRRWARIPDPRALAHILDANDRKVLDEVIASHRDELRAHFRPLGEARREMAGVLRSEPFDPAALDQAFALVREREAETANAMHQFMLDLAPKLSPAGRQRVATLLERRHGHGHGHERDGEPGKGEAEAVERRTPR